MPGVRLTLSISNVRNRWARSGDIRDVISISKLILQDDGHDEIAQIIRSLNKYGCNRVTYLSNRDAIAYRILCITNPVLTNVLRGGNLRRSCTQPIRIIFAHATFKTTIVHRELEESIV
jgi:hypothetical protein